MQQPTTMELEAAFSRSGLDMIGWTFEKAMECENVRRCMEIAARCRREHATTKPTKMPRVVRLPYVDKED